MVLGIGGFAVLLPVLYLVNQFPPELAEEKLLVGTSWNFDGLIVQFSDTQHGRCKLISTYYLYDGYISQVNRKLRRITLTYHVPRYALTDRSRHILLYYSTSPDGSIVLREHR